ncbi:putative cytochrome P450 [Helianthus annuus]|nr:putative cytochrome P450 [Helianthus annuus]
MVINEDDLQKMTYLKAVVLEGLRRHPPAHFVLPHKVMKEVEVQGYMIPQGATINFMVGAMGLDPKVWDEPMEFKPERFLVNDGVFDVSGSKGIKMMPFGAGRRICPGSDLALLHLKYFVVNLIWYFHWSVPDGCHVHLSEKPEFMVVMKNPLRARISSRAEN